MTDRTKSPSHPTKSSKPPSDNFSPSTNTQKANSLAQSNPTAVTFNVSRKDVTYNLSCTSKESGGMSYSKRRRSGTGVGSSWGGSTRSCWGRYSCWGRRNDGKVQLEDYGTTMIHKAEWWWVLSQFIIIVTPVILKAEWSHFSILLCSSIIQPNYLIILLTNK